MLFRVIFIPLFIIYLIIVLVTKSYFILWFILGGGYIWHKFLKKTKKPAVEAPGPNVLIFKKNS